MIRSGLGPGGAPAPRGPDTGGAGAGSPAPPPAHSDGGPQTRDGTPAAAPQLRPRAGSRGRAAGGGGRRARPPHGGPRRRLPGCAPGQLQARSPASPAADPASAARPRPRDSHPPGRAENEGLRLHALPPLPGRKGRGRGGAGRGGRSAGPPLAPPPPPGSRPPAPRPPRDPR